MTLSLPVSLPGSDGLEEEFNLDWIVQEFKEDEQMTSQELWNKNSIQGNMITISCEKFMEEKSALSRLFEAIEKNGFALLNQVYRSNSINFR